MHAPLEIRAATPNCPDPLRPPRTSPQTLSAVAKSIEAASRKQNKELCAGNDALGSAQQQSELLDLIREKAVKRMRELSATSNSVKVESAAEKVQQLRLLMAMRNATVHLNNGMLTITPSIQFSHPAGFGRMEMLAPDENAMLQLGLAEAVKKYNRRMPGTAESRDARNKLIGQLGTRLTAETREAGEVGYNELVAQHPFLLFVNKKEPSPSHILAARTRYGIEVANEARNLEALSTVPPDGKAVSLIFYGPVVSEIIKSKPSYCGAYNSLKKKASESTSLRSLLNTGAGMAAGGACLAGAIMSAGLVGAGCLLLTSAEFMTATYSAKQSFDEKQILYSGVLQGGSLERYENSRDQANAYLAAAGFSGLGVAGSGAAFSARAAKLKAASEPSAVAGAAERREALPASFKNVDDTPVGSLHLGPSSSSKTKYANSFNIDRSTCPECPAKINSLAERETHLGEHVIEDRTALMPRNQQQRPRNSVYGLISDIESRKKDPKQLAELLPDIEQLAKRARDNKTTSTWTKERQESFLKSLRQDSLRPNNFKLGNNGMASVEVESGGNRVVIVFCHRGPCTDAVESVNQSEIVTIYPLCGPDVFVLPMANAFNSAVSALRAVQSGGSSWNNTHRRGLPQVKPCH